MRVGRSVAASRTEDSAGFLGAALRGARRQGQRAHCSRMRARCRRSDGLDHVIVLGAILLGVRRGPGPRLDRRGTGLAARGRRGRGAGAGRLLRRAGAVPRRSAAGSRPRPARRSAGPWSTPRTRAWSRRGRGWSSTATGALPPPHARVLARNEIGVQAFALGRHLAVQFHPEVDGAQLRCGWRRAGGARPPGGPRPGRVAGRDLRPGGRARERADPLVAAAVLIADTGREDQSRRRRPAVLAGPRSSLRSLRPTG